MEHETLDTLLFFDKMPGALPLYRMFARRVSAVCGDCTCKVQKTQISYSNRHVFACISLPGRKFKNAPAVYMLVTFGLAYRVDSPRIAIATEPYPNRWTHHVIVSKETEIDDALMAWVKEAYDFSMAKK